MGIIACPDCRTQVSDVADACPHCGRPEPSKSVQQIVRDREALGADAVLGILWLGHAFVVLLKAGFWPFLFSLFLGPLVWLFV